MKRSKRPQKMRLQALVSLDTMRALKRRAADRLTSVSRVIEDFVKSWKENKK
jgi:hypothetical protein